MRIGTCGYCKTPNVWINKLRLRTLRGKVFFDGEACADCFDKIGPLRHISDTMGTEAPRDSTSGYQDNAIRDMEDG
jgi:hypothetical protein